MKVILFRSVDNLGSAGEVVEVKRGYYRNYLGPRGYAKEATKANLALMESRRKKIDAMVARERAAAATSAEALTGVEVKFQLRANDRGQLFGSINTIDIAKALAELGHQVDRRKIELSEHIKSLGTFPVRVRLYPEVYGEISVTVERLLRPEEIELMREQEEKDAQRAAAKAAKAEAEEKAEAAGNEEQAAEEVLDSAE